MSSLRPLSRFQRWLLKPIGWWTIALPAAATAGLIYLSRWPRLPVEPIEILSYEFRWPREEFRPLKTLDIIFYSAVILWIVFITWTVLWQLARLLLVRRKRFHAELKKISAQKRHGAVAIIAILSTIYILFGWEQRIASRWRAWVKDSAVTYNRMFEPTFPPIDSPVPLSIEQGKRIMNDLLVDGPSPSERLFALAYCIEVEGHDALPAVIHAAEIETNENLLAWELRVIGLCRDPNTFQLLSDHLQDSRLTIRVAAIDAVAILRHPSYPIAIHWGSPELALDTQPPISLRTLITGDPAAKKPTGTFDSGERDLADEDPHFVDPTLRDRLEQIMLSGSTRLEREAAARALVDWPPEQYKLRVAEWGVWMSSKGHFALTQSLLDEIPPFVHRTGNPRESFGDYFLYPSTVFKPIVHVTSNVAMAVDIESYISQGRPWFGYPMPDDFTVGDDGLYFPPSRDGFGGTQAAVPNESDYNRPPVPPLSGLREDYPWLLPPHRLHTNNQGGRFLPVTNFGLHWQSAIVSPTRLPWMAAPAVATDPRFAWWNRLREVPSCWIASRGETERFLYYDGPTRAEVPLKLTLESSGRQLSFEPALPLDRDKDRRDPSFLPLPSRTGTDIAEHEGLYINVQDGQVRAGVVTVPASGSAPATTDPALVGEDAVAGKLREMLVRYGLTVPEADGLIASWAPQFFRTEGRRFLLRLSPEEYAYQCPMQVRPTPTEVVRLGLVLTEFDDGVPTTRPSTRTAD